MWPNPHGFTGEIFNGKLHFFVQWDWNGEWGNILCKNIFMQSPLSLPNKLAHTHINYESPRSFASNINRL